MGQQLLHGTLYATIFQVDKISSGLFDFCSTVQDSSAKSSTKKFINSIKRFILCRPEITGTKLYATIDLDKARVGRTQVVENHSSNPIWNESFRIYCAHAISHVIFTVKYDDPIDATLIGRAYLPAAEVFNKYVVDTWLPILDEERIPVHGHPKIHVRLQFSSVKEDDDWSRGIPAPDSGAVPFTFFKERKNCNVKLYADAHVPDDKMAKYLQDQGFTDPERCWEDIFQAIINARHLIYITGWSVYTKISLVRDPSAAASEKHDMSLGDLLKMKAKEGVNVLVLVWDDRTSIEVFKRDGLMATHDQETYDYFRDTGVHCFLSPRNSDYGSSILQGIQFTTRTTLFTHHQKTVVVDSEFQGSKGGLGKRTILSFLGGIDLCDGRYDTREHSLFRTLNTIHKEDFHQPNFPGANVNKGGPREPWHDIHCRLEGPAAWDVLYNFEQRWRKHIGDKYIYSMKELQGFTIRPTEFQALEDNDPERWNVQIFRSIDGNDAAGFPGDPVEAAESGLITGKNHVIDHSILDAYINAIRRAKNFIYIENQYFLGSSYGWRESKEFKLEDIGAIHLVPKELSLKIVSKIEAGERFTVYVVIPMWPEGVPESESVQAILDWQRRTMEMMYTDIASALNAKGISADLREYLTFFCLGNREIKLPDEYAPPDKPIPDSDYARAQESRRFMIYVHSKMMIVDDEYIIIGSANINQRSMDGARDSEIAMGGYQPMHLARPDQPARGKIFGFRMALWCEHMNYVDDSFFHPESLECVKTVNAIGDENWSMYISETQEKDLPGHLLTYPVHISPKGEVQGHAGVESYFPDTKAPIHGTRSLYLPPILTT
nr:phospholipase D alpha 1-like [Ipomoea batatas]